MYGHADKEMNSCFCRKNNTHHPVCNKL